MGNGNPTGLTSKVDDRPESRMGPRDIRSRPPFSREVLWTVGARLLMAANSVGTGMIVARWLGADGLGIYAALSVASGTTIQIGGAGLTAANVYFISRSEECLKPVFGNAVVFALIGGGILALALVLLASLAPTLFIGIPLHFVAISAALIPSQLLVLFGLNVFLARGRVGTFNLLDTLGQSFLFINAALTLVIAGAGLVQLLSVNTVVGAGMGALISWLVYRYIGQHKTGSTRKRDVRLFTKMMRYGLKFNVAMASTMLVFRVDVLIVNYFRGAAEAGVYSVASQGGLLFMLLPNVIGSLLFPRIASTRDASGELTAVVTRHTAFVLAIAFLLAIPGAFLMPYLYGAPFFDASIQLLILLPGVYLMGLEMVMVQHFVGTGLPAAIPVFWVTTLFFNIALNLAIVPTFGARGASLVSTLSYSLIFALVFIYFRAKTGKRFADTFILRPIEVRPLLAVAGSLFGHGNPA